MKKTVLTFMAMVACLTSWSAEKTASINIDSRIKYQHVTGFGGFSPSPQWQYWLGDAEMDKLFGKGDSQLGLTICRVYISPNKGYWGSGVANVKRAKKYGAFVFASPWSPPASWKDNNSTSNGGKLLESRWGDWANQLNDYYKYMKQQGTTIDAISIQNEPDWNATYESCIWTGSEMAKFLRLHGSKIECKIIAPEAIHFTKSMHEPILNDAEACKNLDILGGHFYGWDGSSYPLAAQKGKEVWMTEFLINERQQDQGVAKVDWNTDGFLFAKSVNDAMLANMSAWVHYSLKRYYGCMGDGEKGTQNNVITKRGWVLSQYAKYVSNTTRIAHALTDATGKLSSSAYLTPSGDSVVVMVINPTADTYKTALTLPFKTKGGKKITTSSVLNASKSTVTIDEDYKTDVTVSPYTVNTYIYVKSAAREDLPDVPEEGKSIFTDGYDMVGAGSVPAGWWTKDENGSIRKAGQYGLGPRIMGFNAEGLMRYGFYFRSGTSGTGYVSYGEDTSKRLNLDAGKYTLTYSMVGYKGTPTVIAYVKTSSKTVVAKQTCTPKATISDNGANARITETTNFSLDFEVKSGGNHILMWEVVKSSGGFNEMLVGNIKLVRHDDAPTGIEAITRPAASSDDALYNLQGQKVGRDYHGVVIRNGKKAMR